MPKANTSLTFPCGITMPNRFLLAPMTNRQSHEDGTLSDEEYHWLTMRSEGGFGMVMTCASHVPAGDGHSPRLTASANTSGSKKHETCCKFQVRTLVGANFTSRASPVRLSISIVPSPAFGTCSSK